MPNGDRHWTTNFRVLTPILVTIACFMLGHLISTTNKIDDKLFKHLTNDELHSPRSVVVGKAEFYLYKDMLEKQVEHIRQATQETKHLIEKLTWLK